MVKDLKTALEVARSPVRPLLSPRRASKPGPSAGGTGPGLDHTAVVRHWEKLAGTELGKKHD